MTVWTIILLASAAVLALKLSGYGVPPSVVEKPAADRTINLLTVALLSALVAVQTVAVGQHIAIDARVPAVALAAVLFALRVPFILVIIAAAGAAALIRFLGGA